jgi:hypothetical protein
MGERSKAMFFFQYFDFAKVAIFSGGGGGGGGGKKKK